MTWGGEQALQAQVAVTFVLSGLGVPLYLLLGHRLELESGLHFSFQDESWGGGGRERDRDRETEHLSHVPPLKHHSVYLIL